ncbi:MAG: sensor histidine kinase, partial [Chitinophagales bacterium]
ISAMFIFRRTGNIALCVNLIAIAATVRVVPSIYLTGGIYSVSLSLLLISPLIAFLLLGNRAGLIWMTFNLLLIIGFFLFYLAGKQSVRPSENLPHATYNMFISIALLFIVLMTVRTFGLITRRARNELAKKNVQLDRSLKELREAQTQLIQSEKMASLGQLTAGVAHEINNPINFISGNVNPLKRDVNEIMSLLEEYSSLNKSNFSTRLDDILKRREEIDLNYTIGEIKSLISGIEEGSKRTAEIVSGLRNFSRLDEEERKKSNVNEGIESTLILIHNKLEESKIELEKKLGNVPEIECYPGQLNQVVMNLLSNAIDAIGKNGKIFLATSADNDFVSISIRDSGMGISEKVKQKIFEPFFTTKEVGKGTGLGLSIAYGIVEKHGGKIEVISEENKGTEFIIRLPVTP